MGESKEIKGLWWLPNASDNQIPGTLNIRNDRIVLETIGSLAEDNPILHFATGKVPQYDVIWGISSEANIDEKHKTNLPTEKGIQLGITVRIQQNPEGKEYQRVFYDISAQRVMLTNIESIAVIR